MTIFDFRDQLVRLEQRVTLLVYIKLFETNIRNAVGQIFSVFRRRQVLLLLLVKNTRQQQAAFQNGDLFFEVTFRLQSTIQRIFNADARRHHFIGMLSGINQTLAQLMVDIELLLNQRVLLNFNGIFRVYGVLRGLLRQG